MLRSILIVSSLFKLGFFLCFSLSQFCYKQLRDTGSSVFRSFSFPVGLKVKCIQVSIVVGLSKVHLSFQCKVLLFSLAFTLYVFLNLTTAAGCSVEKHVNQIKNRHIVMIFTFQAQELLMSRMFCYLGCGFVFGGRGGVVVLVLLVDLGFCVFLQLLAFFLRIVNSHLIMYFLQTYIFSNPVSKTFFQWIVA